MEKDFFSEFLSPPPGNSEDSPKPFRDDLEGNDVLHSILRRNQEGKQAMAVRLEKLGLSGESIRRLLNM